MQTRKHNRLKNLASSVVVTLKLLALLTILLLLVITISEVVAHFSGFTSHLNLFDVITLSHIGAFYSGSFIGVLFAHYHLRKDLKRLQSNLDVDLNKISEEVKSLEDKINQIKL